MTFRPVLRRGAPLLRRDATHLQIGTSPGIVFDDRPGLLPLLRLVDGVRDVQRLQELVDVRIPDLDRPVAAVLTELRALGVVTAESVATPARRRRPVLAVGFETSPEASGLVTVVHRILRASGGTRIVSTEPDLLVITSYGEAARPVFERASLFGRPHLPVVVDEDRVRIGPFVQPGRTPCVACHDLHRTDWDAAWPALLHQLGSGHPPSGPSPLPPLTAHAAAVEIAAEVLTRAAGRPPRTIGGCLAVGPGHDDRAIWPIAFHPRCTCDLLSAA
ncbi:MAG: hypothetical protein JWR55_2152 [Aeromicrobium sp.]|jgi:bacteriocin biosynthesis cyclodehydratase domain-containing protein|nr:hypothetical protein [Aeromicrobium sp.]